MKTEIVVIKYNPSGEVQATIVKFVFELGAILIILGIAGFFAYWSFLQLSQCQISEKTINGRPTLPGLAMTISTLAMLAIAICTGSIKHVNTISNSFLSRKQSIRLTEAGIICPFGETFHLQGRLWRKWEELTGVSLGRSHISPSNTGNQLVLKFADGCKLNLNLHKMQKEDVDKLILAVEMWTPKVVGLPDFYDLCLETRDELKLLDKPSFTSIWNDDLSRRFSLATFIPLPPGAKLQHSRYLLKQRIARGGQGIAYLAEDVTTGQEVVVKEYLLSAYQGKRARENAQREIEAEAIVLNKLSHPQIVQLLDSFSESGRVFLVLRHIKGVNQSDIYSLGGTLFFLCTGSDPEALVQCSLEESHPELPASIRQIAHRCRAQEPSERFQSVFEIMSLLNLITTN